MNKKITDQQLADLAHEYGFEEDVVRAVLEVETRGSGYDKQGRVIILFEPHIFYRELGDTKLRDKAVQEGLAYRSWGTMKYPADSYPRFSKAFSIDPIAAMRSCSWGLPQIMGFNHKAAGFAEVGLMVDAFKESESNQVRAMLEFIKDQKLDRHLREKNWTAFAKGYNGSGYATNRYHTRLAEAYKKWSRVVDTPPAEKGKK